METINKKEYDLVTRVLTEDLAKRELGLCTEEEKAEEEFAVETYKKIGRILVAHKEHRNNVLCDFCGENQTDMQLVTTGAFVCESCVITLTSAYYRGKTHE